MTRTCEYCGTDISALHHNATHCHGCQELYDADRREQVRQTAWDWRRRTPTGIPTGRKCGWCNGDVMTDSGYYFHCCHQCFWLHQRGQRLDDDFLYEMEEESVDIYELLTG